MAGIGIGTVEQQAAAYASEGDGADDFAEWALASGLVSDEASDAEINRQLSGSDSERQADRAETEREPQRETQRETDSEEASTSDADAILFGEDDKALIARLDAAYNPPRDERMESLNKLNARIRFLEGRLEGQAPPSAQTEQQSRRLQPTGDPDVDEVLASRGLLLDPLEETMNSNVQSLQKQLDDIRKAGEDERIGREIGQRVLSEAEGIAKVFDGLTPRTIAAQAIRRGISPLEFAREFYNENEWLGSDGLPNRRFKDSTQQRTAMPQATTGQSSAGRGSASSSADKKGSASAWAPTNDISARLKALQDLG